MAQPVYSGLIPYSPIDISPEMQIRLAKVPTPRKLHSRTANQRPVCPLEANERLAAYLVQEPHVGAILRLLLEMNEEQRRMSLMMMQCIGLGIGSPPEAE